MRVVLDTNVLISAVLTKGKPRKILAHVMRFHSIVCSAPLLEEYSRVLSRSEFDRYVSKEKRAALLNALAGTEIVRVSKISASRDPDDNIVIGTALGGRVDVLVTGDSDILCLRPFSDLAIVSPDEYVTRFMR